MDVRLRLDSLWRMRGDHNKLVSAALGQGMLVRTDGARTGREELQSVRGRPAGRDVAEGPYSGGSCNVE